ncbi:MAG: nitroreductase family protein [Chloroflexi bacterium]|jgi:nitroreductase|nr:nitroreductase family protein [Chloroflexota bacterium]MBT5627230.1 nitroreductase family protein [Chloroflexota bacterium]
MTNGDSKNSRQASASVEPMFIERWSSKAFADKPLADDEIASLFEAAHWAPSASNRQPWVFVYATDGPDRERFNALLSEGNARYAPNAAMMVLVFARTVDDEGNKIRTAQFDTGAAWMSLALQANRMGLNTRAMGGIDLDAAYDVAGVSRDNFETICAIAVGTRGTDDDIHPRMVKQNLANDRKDVSDIAFKGSYTG